MSLVLALSIGIRASTSPGRTFAPGSTDRIGLDREQEAGVAARSTACRPCPCASWIADRRLEVAAARGRTPVDDLALGDAGRLVGRFLHGDAVDQILERDLALDFGQDRTGVGVPLGDTLAALHLVAIVHEACANRR